MTNRARPLVSIIAAIHDNSPAELATLLRSVLDQTHRGLELVIVDRSGRDRAADRIMAMAGPDPRLRLIRLDTDAGDAAARNSGLAAAAGDFAGFIMPGEVWAPDKIARQLDRFATARSWVGVVYGWSDEGAGDAVDRPRCEGEVYARLLARPFIHSAGVPLFRRTLLQDVGGLDPALPACADEALYLVLAERCDFACVPDLLVSRSGGPPLEPEGWRDAQDAILRWARLSHPELPLWLFALGQSWRSRHVARLSALHGRLPAAAVAWMAGLLWNAISAVTMLAGGLLDGAPDGPSAVPWRRDVAITRYRIDRSAAARQADPSWQWSSWPDDESVSAR